jgi:hypothetical protein
MRGRQHGTLIDDKVGTVCTVNDVIHTRFKIVRGIRERKNWGNNRRNLDILNNEALTIVTKFVKEGGERLFLQIGNCIKPVLIIIQSVIQNTRIPINITCPENMREGLPFCVSIGAHRDIRKAAHNVEGVNISVKGSDAL